MNKMVNVFHGGFFSSGAVRFGAAPQPTIKPHPAPHDPKTGRDPQRTTNPTVLDFSIRVSVIYFHLRCIVRGFVRLYYSNDKFETDILYVGALESRLGLLPCGAIFHRNRTTSPYEAAPRKSQSYEIPHAGFYKYQNRTTAV